METHLLISKAEALTIAALIDAEENADSGKKKAPNKRHTTLNVQVGKAHMKGCRLVHIVGFDGDLINKAVNAKSKTFFGRA